MIEIEAIGDLKNRIMLNEIHSFITNSFPDFSVNKQSKYERGINSTLDLYNNINKESAIYSDENMADTDKDSSTALLVKKLVTNK